MATTKFYVGQKGPDYVKALNDLWAVASVGGNGGTADFTPTDRIKLDGIAIDATKNQTDATLKARANHTGTQSADTVVDGVANKVFTAAEKTKLGAVSANATQNSTDAQLRDRQTHLGFQPISSITGLQAALDAKQAVTTFKTINGVSIVGTGDIPISGSGGIATVYDVAGKTGNVVLVKGDVGLGNVDNTSDAAKPVSSLTQTALNNKQATLISGTNIKTVNSQSIVGSGNINISLLETVQTLTFANPIVWDASLGKLAKVELTGTTPISLPTNLVPGWYALMVDQNAVGAKNLTWSAGYHIGAEFTLSVAPNTRDVLFFMSDGVEMYLSAMAKGKSLSTGGAPALLPAPTVVTANNATSNSMTISWNAVNGTYGYQVERNGVKVNTAAISGLSFIDTGLNPSSTYTWTVKTLNSALTPGAASTGVIGTTSAASTTVNDLMPMPANVVGMYFEVYYGAASFSLLDIPPQVNVVYLFNAQPAGTPAVPNQRDNLGNGTFQMLNIGESHISIQKIQAIRAAGKRVILTVGGAQNGFNFGGPGISTAQARQRSDNFIASFKNMVTQLGGKIDGIDWNTFEAYMRAVYQNNPADTTQNTIEMVYISQTLREFYGPNFSVTMPPAPDVFGTEVWRSPYDLIVAQALNNAGVLTYAAPQFYDSVYNKDVNYVSDKIIQWCNALGESKVVFGTTHGNKGGNYNDCLTEAENYREVDRIRLTKKPRGYFLWSMHDTIKTGLPAFIDTMSAKMSAGTVVTPPVVNNAAVTTAFAYSGGQNGAWFEMAAANLRQGVTVGSAAVTATGQPVGYVVDLSTNANPVYITDPTPSFGTYNVSGAKTKVYFYQGLASTTGGGSGENTANGFTLCMAVAPKGYYSHVWSDKSAANTGRNLYYDSDENGFVFSVGTGTARVSAIVSGLGTIYVAPTAIFNVKAWHDRTANTINLQVNGGTVVTTACPTFSAGSNNFAVNSQFGLPNADCLSEIFACVHVNSALTQTIRDDLSTYVGAFRP